MELSNDQRHKYSTYQSLDLLKKPYQEKALNLAKAYFSAKKLKKPSLLDIGCADGSFAAYAASQLSFTPHGLDISPAVKQAKKVLASASQHDLGKPLPFPDNSFDLIFATEVIEHLFDTDLFLTEIKRVLKPKGLLILSTPNLASLKNRFLLLLGHYPQYLEYSTAGAGHIHLYTLPILTSQISTNRLKLLSAASVNFITPFITKPWFPPPLRRLSLKLGDVFPTLGSHLIVTATI